jgi:hypothetical protein
VTDSAILDLVRSIVADWERGDYSSTGWADPEIEFVIADGPQPGTSTGLDPIEQMLREYLSTWVGYRLVVDELRELDGQRVLALARASGHGKGSALELGQMRASVTALFEIRGGKITKIVRWWDRDRALADLGIPPEGDA